MWASHMLGPHVMDTKAGALRHRSIVLSGWSRVSDGRVAPSHPPPSPPKKGRGQYKFALPRFALKYLAAPIPALQNLSSPPSPSAPRLLKSLIRRQPSNRPLSRLFPPPFPTSVPDDDDDEDDGRASPPHRSYLIYALVHRTGWFADNVGRRNRRASQTPSSTASGALHRRRLPAHRGYFTEHIVAPPPLEAVWDSPTVSYTAL